MSFSLDNEVTLKVTTTSIKYIEEDPVTHIKKTKVLDPVSFCSILAKHGSLTSGMLPPFSRYYARLADGTEVVVLEEPAVIRRVNYGDRPGESFVIPTPPTTWLFRVSGPEGKKKVTTAKVYVSINPIYKPTDRLYRMFLSNINDNGTICWNTARVSFDMESLNDLQRIPNSFWMSNFNNHLDGQGFQNTDGLYNTRLILAHLNGKTLEEFPVKHLRPLCTWAEAVASVQNNR